MRRYLAHRLEIAHSLLMIIRPPITEAEFKQYYGLRWKILRAPWDQPPGSEKDAFEKDSFHIAAWDNEGRIIGVGRLHHLAQKRAQLRFMAVEPGARGHGVGKAILESLEVRAIESGISEVILHSREDAVSFYRANGYQVRNRSHTLFDAIPHFEMYKRLAPG
jgi:predicted GNAT family N-acyltransferase